MESSRFWETLQFPVVLPSEIPQNWLGTGNFRETLLTFVALSASLLLGVNHAQANMFENLVDVANGALPSYGRTDAPGRRTDLTAEEISGALRELLTVGCDNVVAKLERYGYNNPAVRIELPKKWRKARKIASRIGYRSEFDKLERSLAEIAVAIAPDTRDLLSEMITDLDLGNPGELLSGGEIAATAALRERAVARLAEQLRPIVSAALASSGAMGHSNEIVRHVKHLPVIKLSETDFTDYVVRESLDGFFHYLALEERAIRLHPYDQQSDLLKRVLG
ncbi:MAG: DUF4197 domain-containing protein, partial [Pseudomonadota bacterium]